MINFGEEKWKFNVSRHSGVCPGQGTNSAGVNKPYNRKVGQVGKQFISYPYQKLNKKINRKNIIRLILFILSEINAE